MAKQTVAGFINNVSEEEIIDALKLLQADPAYETKPLYRGNVEKWPTHEISFIDYHLGYLKSNATLEPRHYIANLRLMLRKNSRLS